MRNKDEYQELADCIRSDQLSARQVVEEFEADPEFAKWYKNYNAKTGIKWNSYYSWSSHRSLY